MSTQEKFAEAYDKYADAIFRHCFIRVYDRELAKELMQESFMKAWKHYGETGEGDIENLRALLYKIATNLIIDHSRRPGSKKAASLEDLVEAGLEPGEDHSKQMKDQLDAKEALKSLDLLKEEYREVLTLHYLQDLPLNQTAEILGISPNLVSVRLNRAMKELRKHFKHHERT
ncbi:MAG: RNA polymerase sigma factor [Candidatus Gracilibacteria bacterium]|jgi:RNA polymerase sigma-70 factor (ECF subfamily)